MPHCESGASPDQQELAHQDPTGSSSLLSSTLQALNESASRLFCSGAESSVEEGTAIMDEVVIPCLHLMSRDPALCQEDQDAMESIRNHWCCCLSQDMDGESHLAMSHLLCADIM